MEAQGYQVQDNVLYQDNQSAILLEKNGKASSSRRTKHINIRYFFITDRVDKGDVSLVWCPTADMIGDYATKPVQGALFRKFRDQIMGVVPAQEPGTGKSKTKIDESETHKIKPTKGNKKVKPTKGKTVKFSLVPPKEKGRNHRSVLGESTKDSRSKTGHHVEPKCSVVTNKARMTPRCNKQATRKISLTSIN